MTPPSWLRLNTHALTILWLSTLLSCFFLYTGSFTFPGGAIQFTLYADYLAHGGVLHPSIAQRDAGFPLLLLLGLYPYTGSFVGITLIHTLFSILIPVLVMGIIGPRYPRAAFYTALATIVSLVPFQFIKFIHHDHAYIFLLILALYYAVRFVREQKTALLYCMTFAAIACGLARPAGNWMLLAMLCVMLLLSTRHWRHYLACTVLFFASAFIYQQHREHAFNVRQEQKIPSYTGVQSFYNFYVNSRDYGITLDEHLGPNMQAMIARMRQALGPIPRESQPIKNMIASGNYSPEFTNTIFNHDTPDAFVQSFFAYPNFEYVELLSTLIADHDALALGAAREIALAYPLYSAKFISMQLWQLLFTPGYQHTRGSYAPSQRLGKPYLQMTMAQVHHKDMLPARGTRELSHVPAENELHWLAPQKYFGKLFRSIYRPLTYITALLTLLGAGLVAWHLLCQICRRASPLDRAAIHTLVLPFSLVFMVYAYNAMVIAVFVEPHYRYHYFIMLPQILCAGMCLIMIKALKKQQLDINQTPVMPASVWMRASLPALVVLIVLWPFFLYMSL